MWILSALEFTYRVMIDRYSNAPGIIRSNIYGINTYDKTDLKQKKFMIGTTEYNNETTIMNAY